MRLLAPVLAGLVAAGVMATPAGQGLAEQVTEVAAPAAHAAPQAVATAPVLKPGDVVPASALPPVEEVALPPLAKQVKAIGARNRLVVPSLDAALPLAKAPVRKGRVVEPRGIKKAGWVTASRKPCSAEGSSWLLFHRDTAGGGRGRHSALFDLPGLRKGDTVEVRWGKKTCTYAVTGHELRAKNDVPVDLLRRDGAGSLVMSTCGGPRVLGKDGRVRWSKRSYTRFALVASAG